MITIISGVPGSGKTALVVDMLMDEIKTGRKIFTVGIPKLLLNVNEGGDVHEWQNGSWLKIDKFDPELTKKKGMKSQWFPRSCPESCPYLSTCDNYKTELPNYVDELHRDHPITQHKPRIDFGSLIVIDEAHAYFPQRASGKAPPPYVEALNVHRHQGLDIWFVTQRPSFLDPFVRGLSSRHIHLGLNAFSFTGSRVKYEWSEYQETLNRSSKMLATRSDYKPSPAVFPLYASATVHTKLDQRMPTIMKVFIIAVCCFVGMVGFAYSRVSSRVDLVKTAQASQAMPSSIIPASSVESSSSVAAADGGGGGRSTPTATASAAMVSMPPPLIGSCISNASKCQCYSDKGVKLDLVDAECRISAESITDKFKVAHENTYSAFPSLPH